MTPDEIVSRLLYRDQDVLVIDKPAGLAVHAGPGTPDHLELYLDPLRFGWAEPPRLAHRLDRDTAGCLILGRHDKALKRLGRMFETHRIDKVYWSVCHGAPPEPAGRIDAPLLKRSTESRGWRVAVDPAGKQAITDWRVLGTGEGLSWVEWRPRTGRTHQIRAHAAHLGCPLLGDVAYGPEPLTEEVLHLQSHAVTIPPLAPSKPPIHAEAPPPPHMCRALRSLGWGG
jgi:RluA family pseudouridine synthase